jgi:hypothetical protein
VGKAKDLIVKPISAQDANRIIKALHYSGKVVNNSQLHLGVFMGGRCGGAMQFGPSLDKRKIQGLVTGTLWNEFIELNRMAFADWLPRNGESRCIGYAMRWIKKTYPWIKWVVSFADGTQCGDGTIYRASGFVLTGIKENNQIWEAPSGKVFQSNSARGVSNCNLVKAAAQKEALKTLPPATFSRTSLTDGRSKQQQQQAKSIISRTTSTKAKYILETGASSMKIYKDAGWKPKAGYQLRYIYFLDPAARDRLTVPVLPFSEIDKRGAGMYKGKQRLQGASSETNDTPGVHPGEGGEAPTDALHKSGGKITHA